MKIRVLLLKFLIAILFFCTACSSNDDDNNVLDSLAKQIIGTWKPVKEVTVCSTGSMDIENYSACEQTGRLSINANGTFTETYFDEYSSICEADGVLSGTWEIINDQLTVIETGFGNIDITFFEITGNTLRLGQYDEEFICDGDKMSSHYYNEYTRI